MDQHSRIELYDRLTLLSDWLDSGRRRARPKPAFDSAPSGTETASQAASAENRPARAQDADLEAVAAEVLRCERCRLAAGRRHTVFGEGAEHPDVLVVGEGPGAEEDLQGRAFVGPAGRLLDKMLSAVGLDRNRNCYIANIVKCRPPMNRDPAPDEREACLPYLERQIRLLNPKIILALGRTAAQTLLGTSEGITRLRGKFFMYKDIPLVPTFHPSALLRDENLKRPAWEDLKKLRAFLDGGPPE